MKILKAINCNFTKMYVLILCLLFADFSAWLIYWCISLLNTNYISYNTVISITVCAKLPQH